MHYIQKVITEGTDTAQFTGYVIGNNHEMGSDRVRPAVLIFQVLRIAAQYPKFVGVVRTDPARLTAQIVSGIGFLGAGTIVVTRHSVSGLTTAASLWATVSIGIAVGMGYYQIALIGATLVLIVLAILKKAIRIHTAVKLEIKYRNKATTVPFLNNYFAERKVRVEFFSFSTSTDDDGNVVNANVFTLDAPKKTPYHQLMSELSTHGDILQVRLIRN